MPPRLTDRFPIGTAVEICFNDKDWLPGKVTAHAHPGIWVEATEKVHWFVTNGRRIRKSEADETQR